LQPYQSRIADACTDRTPSKAMSSPFKFPTFSIKQHWHERYQQDPANRWLRSTVADLFLQA